MALVRMKLFQINRFGAIAILLALLHAYLFWESVPAFGNGRASIPPMFSIEGLLSLVNGLLHIPFAFVAILMAGRDSELGLWIYHISIGINCFAWAYLIPLLKYFYNRSNDET